MPPREALHYHRIRTDYGGTYTHNTSPEPDSSHSLITLPGIGTSHCVTCVAVYMHLSPTTCFVAHINATHTLPSPYDEDTTTEEDYHDLRIVTEAEGAFVYDETIRLLQEESAHCNWPPVDLIGKVVLVCPNMWHRDTGVKLSGIYVVQAIGRFLRWKELYVETGAEGFVVESATGQVTLFPLEEGDGLALPDDRVNYDSHEADGNQPPRWFIDIHDLWRRSNSSNAHSVPARLAALARAEEEEEEGEKEDESESPRLERRHSM